MANKQIDELTELTTASGTDLLLVYDLNEAGSEKTKKIEVSNIGGGIWIGPSWTGINATTSYLQMSFPSEAPPDGNPHRRLRMPYNMTLRGISLTVDDDVDTYSYTINVYVNEVSQEEIVFTHPTDFDVDATWDDKAGQKDLSSPISISPGDRISFEYKSLSGSSGREIVVIPYGRS
jgi:hypothetical protein